MSKSTELKRFYDAFAEKYPQEKLYSSEKLLERLIHNKRKEIILNFVKNLELNSILDVGCGEGLYTNELEKICPSAMIVGLDLSHENLLRAMNRTNNVEYFEGDAQNLPFKDSSFDFVMCCETLEHLPDDIKALNEIIRVCKRYILLSVPNVNCDILNIIFKKNTIEHGLDQYTGHFREYSSKDFIKSLKNKGLKIIKVRSCGISFPLRNIIAKIMPSIFEKLFHRYEHVFARVFLYRGQYTVVLCQVKNSKNYGRR
jgi:ubiquinone/menaquinone biosynthesis C-methylase UbiE